MQVAEISQLTAAYYAHLMRTFVGIAHAYTLKAGQVLEHFSVPDMSIPDRLAEQKKAAVFLGSHRGNWELAALAVGLYFRQPVWVVYKPLKNKFINRFLISTRAKFNIRMVPMHELRSLLNTELHIRPVIIMLADQFPVGKSKLELEFLGLPTLWLAGADILVKRYRLQPFYFELSDEGDKSIAAIYPLRDEDPLRHYVQQLENSIRKEPVNWLWSHRRWKNIEGFYQG